MSIGVPRGAHDGVDHYDPEDWMTTAETLVALGLSRSYFSNYLAGYVESLNVKGRGNPKVWLRSDIEELVRSRSRPPAKHYSWD